MALAIKLPDFTEEQEGFCEDSLGLEEDTRLIETFPALDIWCVQGEFGLKILGGAKKDINGELDVMEPDEGVAHLAALDHLTGGGNRLPKLESFHPGKSPKFHRRREFRRPKIEVVNSVLRSIFTTLNGSARWRNDFVRRMSEIPGASEPLVNEVISRLIMGGRLEQHDSEISTIHTVKRLADVPKLTPSEFNLLRTWWQDLSEFEAKKIDHYTLASSLGLSTKRVEDLACAICRKRIVVRVMFGYYLRGVPWVVQVVESRSGLLENKVVVEYDLNNNFDKKVISALPAKQCQKKVKLVTKPLGRQRGRKRLPAESRKAGVVGICAGCQKGKFITALGLCYGCYQRQRRAKQRLAAA